MQTPQLLQRAVFRKFKAHGLTIHADACRAVANVLTHEDDQEGSLELVIAEIKSRLDRGELQSVVIDVNTVADVVAELSKNEDEIAQESLQVLDAFSAPKLVYEPLNKLYRIQRNPSYKLHAPPASRAAMFRERLLLTQQRLLRNPLFRPPQLGSTETSHLTLSTIEGLIGSQGSKCLLGMLTQPEEGVYYLEDTTSHVRLDLSQVASAAGIFTEGSIVLVEGEMHDGRFRAQMMGFAPAEERHLSLHAMGGIDVFGNGSTVQQREQMAELEQQATDFMMVILSDVHLDNLAVMDKLEVLLQGFADIQAPLLFVFLGNFLSVPLGYGVEGGGAQRMKAACKALASTIKKFDNLRQNARFVFLQGPQDAGAGSALPRPKLPNVFASELQAVLSHCVFASNPCRIRFFNQEIVLFRDDILKKMQRHAILPLAEAENAQGQPMDVTEHLVHTLLDQGHLCPLPLTSRPIYWELDYTLRLFPLPDLVVLADNSEQYMYEHEGCIATNPGSFSSDSSFIVYRPALRTVEFSRID